MTSLSDKESLVRCQLMIEEKLGWTSANEWRNFEFSELSERIWDATGVQLSTTTLKRIFGKLRYESLPSSSTLNTLSRYLGFENWMQFKINQPVKAQQQSNTPVISNKKQVIRRVLFTGIFFTLLLISAFGFIVFSNDPVNKTYDDASVSFKSRTLAEGLPNSVVFQIGWGDIKSKNVWIQQSWDSTRTVKLTPGQKEATGIYYIPGYFKAKLIVEGKIIKEHDLYIPSNDWMATLDREPIPTYVKKEELLTNGEMSVGTQTMEAIRSSEKPLVLTYHLVRSFNDLSSDNFKVETRFRNTYAEGPAICKTTKLFILCSNGAFIIPFTIPGCASSINLKLGDNTREGKSNDLSAFGTDPALPMKLSLEIKDRKAMIFLNGKLIQEGAWEKDAGKIVGFRYSFLGAGAVDYLRLYDGKSHIVYQNEF